MTSEHTREVTLALSQLVNAGYLESAGQHRGKIYHLKGIQIPTPDNDAGKSITFVTSPKLDQLSLFEGPDLDTEGPELSNEGPDLALNTPDQDNTEVETPEANELWSSLWVIGEQVRSASSRKQKSEVEQAIIALCKEAQPHCLRLGDIAQLLGMKPDTLRRNYLSKMVKEQVLFLAYPTIPNHPEQGYKLHKD